MTIALSEQPPKTLDARWLAFWRLCLSILKEQGTWHRAQRPLLDEFVYALIGAEDARKGFKWLDALEVYATDAEELPPIAWSTLGAIAGALPTQWDRHTKRASALADQLALTPRGRKAAGLGREASRDEPVDPFTFLDAGDELATRRQRATATKNQPA